jgi:hypothetical protein
MSRYVYRLTTPFGSSLHEGEGDVMQWPASLKRRCWFWWLLNPDVVVARTTLVEFESWQLGLPVRKRAYVCPFEPWDPVYRWPVRRIFRKDPKPGQIWGRA